VRRLLVKEKGAGTTWAKQGGGEQTPKNGHDDTHRQKAGFADYNALAGIKSRETASRSASRVKHRRKKRRIIGRDCTDGT